MKQTRRHCLRVNQVAWLCFLFSLSTALLGFSNRVSAMDYDRSLYYQRYASYPQYCSDPIEMTSRSIPPLPKSDNATTYNTHVKQVTTIIRHGARTPIHSKNCWKGHWNAPDGVWDCPLTTLLATRPNSDNHPSDDRGQFLVEKIYDAFLGEKVPSPYRNTMNGTCQDGQLIQQGYDQQVMNGKYLRDAYICNDGDDDGSSCDPRLSLFKTSALNEAQSGNPRFLDGAVRYRSDDDQRTLASGQVLLASMFGPEAEAYRTSHNGANPVVVHHTGDKDHDILSSRRGNSMCPKQKAVMERALASAEYRAFDESDESRLMRQLIDDELEPEGVHFGGIDCLMTSICTDRRLPEVLNDYKTKVNENDPLTKQYGPNRFQRLRDYVVQNMTFISRFNDSELSKMDMGPLWAEILDSEEDFALFSAHDSTIYPLMSSLGEAVWNATDFPPYASMMVIEFHEVTDKQTGLGPPDFPSGRAFRLIYNGRVLTWLMEGCSANSHLCDFDVFRNRVFEFATRKHHGCGVEEGTSNDAPSDLNPGTMSELLASWDGSYVLIASMIASFVFGSLLTCVVVQCCRWRPRRRQRDESQLVSLGREPSAEFMDEPDVVIS